MISFVVKGEPVAQGRPRTTVIGGRAVVYDPTKSRNFKQLVANIAQEYAPEQLITGPVALSINVYRSIPKSFSRKKRDEALSGLIRPTTKPDVSNYCKGIEDAINGVIIKDDSQIVGLLVSKWYGDVPRVEVSVDYVADLRVQARQDKTM